MTERITHLLLIAFFAVQTGLFFTNCRKPEGIHPLTYLLIPQLRGGNERPSKIASFTGKYDPYLKQYFLKWTESIDPDSKTEVPYYKLYIYYELPITYYREGNLLTQTPNREYPGPLKQECIIDPTQCPAIPVPRPVPYLEQDVYFIVTGSDGQSESLPSETLTVWTGINAK